MTAAPGAAVFLDRDEVLIRDVYYLCRVEQIEVLAGARIERAPRQWSFDSKNAYFVGDQAGDMELAERVGAQGMLIREATAAGSEVLAGAQCRRSIIYCRRSDGLSAKLSQPPGTSES